MELSWNDRLACAVTDAGGKQIALTSVAKIKPAHVAWNGSDNQWSKGLPAECQATSVVLCSDAVLVAGGRYAGQPVTCGGFVAKLSLEKGETVAMVEFAAPVIRGGLAVAGPAAYVALEDGSVVCLGQ